MIEPTFGLANLSNVQVQGQQERILLVNENAELTELLKATFCLYHWHVISANSAAEARYLLNRETKQPDAFSVALLDITLPDQDGLAFGQQLLQKFSPLALIFLTQCNDLELKVRALMMGADDYLVLPVELAEITARVERSLRWRRQGSFMPFRYKALEIDYIQGRVRLHKTDIPLSLQEYRFMCCLARALGQVVSSLELASQLWPDGFTGNEEELVKKVKLRVQNKLNYVASEVKLIHNVPGVGYYLEWRPIL